MSKEVICLDKYNDMIQIDTLHPVKKSSYSVRCRQTIRMNYAAEVNKLDIRQRIDFLILLYQENRVKYRYFC